MKKARNCVALLLYAGVLLGVIAAQRVLVATLAGLERTIKRLRSVNAWASARIDARVSEQGVNA